KEVDAIFIDEIRKANLYDEIWQALATLLPVKSVGVKDGKRVYEEVCTLRAVNSIDAMSASIYPFSGEFMNRTVLRILNEVPTVSRVLWDVSPKPPGTIEWE
ncbi:MAG TPA: GMP synthase (glutamine-hydrolyzing), partial [Sphaerochaeta sp.]|nr:GMP synthase (glutamine-hydrolyzing) [Sphaerochaeta sp.]